MRATFSRMTLSPRLFVLISILAPASVHAQSRVASPDGHNQIAVEIREGRLVYGVTRDGRPLILPSVLGFEFNSAPRLRDSLRVTDTTRQSVDQTWNQPRGEGTPVRDQHNDLKVAVAE